jgi:hypothetical protein
VIRLSWPVISSGKRLSANPGETGLAVVSSRQRLTYRAIVVGILIMDERPETDLCSWTGVCLCVLHLWGYMLNVTAEEPGGGVGVLLRAIVPLEGINLMKRLRKTDKLRDLVRGPGRLAAALQINQRLDGVDLCASGRFGLGLRFGRLRTLAQLCASASRVRWTCRCVSLRWAAHSLAAPSTR